MSHPTRKRTREELGDELENTGNYSTHNKKQKKIQTSSFLEESEFEQTDGDVFSELEFEGLENNNEKNHSATNTYDDDDNDNINNNNESNDDNDGDNVDNENAREREEKTGDLFEDESDNDDFFDELELLNEEKEAREISEQQYDNHAEKHANQIETTPTLGQILSDISKKEEMFASYLNFKGVFSAYLPLDERVFVFASTDQTQPWSNLIESLKNTIENLIFIFTPQGIMFNQLDDAHICVLQGFIPKEKLAVYHCSEKEYVVVVNIKQEFAEYVKTHKNAPVLHIAACGENPIHFVTMYQMEERIEATRFPTVDQPFSHLEFEGRLANVYINMPTKRFSDMIKSKLFGTSLSLSGILEDAGNRYIIVQTENPSILSASFIKIKSSEHEGEIVIPDLLSRRETSDGSDSDSGVDNLIYITSQRRPNNFRPSASSSSSPSSSSSSSSISCNTSSSLTTLPSPSSLPDGLQEEQESENPNTQIVWNKCEFFHSYYAHFLHKISKINVPWIQLYISKQGILVCAYELANFGFIQFHVMPKETD
jgi:Nucleic-acid-binding protein possibly involved in ribosomal biogenesis